MLLGSSINSPHSSWATSNMTRNGLYEPSASNEISNGYLSRASWKFLENDHKNSINQRFWQTATSSSNLYLTSKPQDRGLEHEAPRPLHSPLNPRPLPPQQGIKRKLPSELDLDLTLSLRTNEAKKKMKTAADIHEEVDSSLSLSLFSPSKSVVRDEVASAAAALDLSL